MSSAQLPGVLRSAADYVYAQCQPAAYSVYLVEQGRFAEAETIVRADLPANEAAANVAYLKQMLSRKDNPRTGAARVPVASLNRPD